MIDIQSETLIGFADAARRLPCTAKGRRVHPKTVARWALRGFCGVTLESLRIGNRRVTSIEACQRFFDAITRKTADSPPPSVCNENVKAQLRQRGLI